MRNVSTVVVFLLLLTGCGTEKDEDVSLQKTPVSWPLTGGLDTMKSPLAIQPGSHLTLDNVIQVRLNEWRRRGGFSHTATDDTANITSQLPYFVGAAGDSGMYALTRSGSWKWSASDPNGWSNAYNALPSTGVRKRTPLAQASVNQVGFAQLGNVLAVATVNGNLSKVDFIDKASTAVLATVTGNWLAARGAALGNKLLMFYVDSGAALGVVSFDITTAVATNTASVKTGLHATLPWLDARYYDDAGATVTVVARSSADATVYLEYNPATGALATNTTIAGVSCANTLALLAPPPGNSTARRYVGSSHTTPTTRVTIVTSAGAIVTNEQVEAVASTQITGVSTDGTNWAVVYRTTAPELRINLKFGGVIDTPVNLALSAWGTGGYIDSQAWFEPNVWTQSWMFLVGLHSQDPDDPQDTWAEVSMNTSTKLIANAVAVVSSLSAAPKLTYPQAIYQVQRTAEGRFSSVLPVNVVYEDNAGTIVRHYGLSLFEETYLQQADVAADPTGKPVKFERLAFAPSSQLSWVSGGVETRLGSFNPPRILAVTPSVGAGGLTPLAQYGYVAVEENIDPMGNVWRSPPSVPILVTLGAADNTVTVTYSSWNLGQDAYSWRVGIYRTSANGSSYRRIASFRSQPGAGVVVVDTFADAAQVDGEVLYTIGELSTAITPPARSVFFHDDRMWAINAEYPTEAWYTKNLRPGRQPEFTNEGIVDLDDEFGDLTGGISLDTQSVLFKRNAIYFGSGDGFTDSGSGNNYRFDRIQGDVGALAGSPLVAADNKVYFVGERGIHTVDKQGQVVFQDAIDQYLHQPQVQKQETVYDGCFVPATNEVVFLTTNYLLVHNLTFKYWRRVTGMSGMRRCLVVNGQLVLFRNDGTVWREGDHTQLTDGGTAFEGIIRSPWMRPTQGAGGPGTASTATAGQQGMRCYRGRVVYTRTSGGSTVNLRGRIYRNNDDADYEEFTSKGIPGAVLSGTGEMIPKVSKCTSFSLQLALPAGDCTVRIDGFAAIVGTRQGALVTDQGSRWK